MSTLFSAFNSVITRDGPMWFPRFDRYVGVALEIYGEYSPDERATLECCVAPGDTVVQVGANVGALTIPLARAVGRTGHVFAFEPQEMLARALIANTMATAQYHVAVIAAAVGAERGTARMPAQDYASAGNFGGVALADQERPDDVVVPVDTLDLALARVPSCRLLHIDAEGSEMAVLAGAVAFLRKHRPIIYLEIDRPAVRAAMPAWLAANGYSGWEHHPSLYGAGNFRGVAQNVFADTSGRHIVSINLMCLPDERVDDLAQLIPIGAEPFASGEADPNTEGAFDAK